MSIVRNIDVMNEILIENEPGKEGEDDFLLMQELYSTLEAMQERATQLIGRVSEEIVLGGCDMNAVYIYLYILQCHVHLLYMNDSGSTCTCAF